MRSFVFCPCRFVCILSLVILLSFSVHAAPPVNRAAVMDFDGDGKTDYLITRAERRGMQDFFDDRWYILYSSDFSWSGVLFGADTLGDHFVPADYDGDGKWDVAVWRDAGTVGSQTSFYILRSSDQSLQVVPWGIHGDDPLETQDFDGDGKADPTVVRYVKGQGKVWYSLLSQTHQIRSVSFGLLEDVSIRGDFDGDGKADLAVYRTEQQVPMNTFFVLRTSDGQVQSYTFGNHQTDSIVPGDFDGDGKTDFAVARGDLNSNQIVWYWRRSSDGVVRGQQFGAISPGGQFFDGAVPGDYDGDGKTDLAIWRRNSIVGPAYFYVQRSRDGFTYIQWGNSNFENCPGSNLQVHRPAP
jgi:hypothetical protein